MKFSTTVLTDGQVKAMIRREFDKKNCQKSQRILSIGWTWKNYTGKIFVIYSFSKVVHLVNLILMTNVLRDFDFFLAFS